MWSWLFAGRFSADRATYHEQMRCHVRARFELPGGMQEIEIVTTARNVTDAKYRVATHHEQVIVIYDSCLVDLGQGTIKQIARGTGLEVVYTCVGSWRLHNNDVYTTDISDTDTIGSVMQAMLTAKVPAVNVDSANFDGNTTTVFHLSVQQDLVDVLPGEQIEKFLEASSPTTNDTYDYWTQMREPSNGIFPKTDNAFYKIRTNAEQADWYIYEYDLVDTESISVSDTFNFATSVRVEYGWTIGSHDGSNNVQNLTDNGRDFVADGAQKGDIAYNMTQNWNATVTGFSSIGGGESNNRVNMVPEGFPSTEDWDTGDKYTIKFDGVGVTAATTSASKYGGATSTLTIEAHHLNDVQAAQLAANALAIYNNPVYRQSFIIGSPKIRGRDGALWPVWYLLTKPYRILLASLDEVSANLNGDPSNLSGFWVSAADFDSESMTMRVTPELPSDRLDSMLRRAGVTNGYAIDAGHRHGHTMGAGSMGIPTNGDMWRWGRSSNELNIHSEWDTSRVAGGA